MTDATTTPPVPLLPLIQIDHGLQSNTGDRVLTYNDVCELIEPINTRLDKIDKTLDDIRAYIDDKVEERNTKIAALEAQTNQQVTDIRKQVKDVLEGMNRWGESVDKAIKGFTNQVATTQIRYTNIVELSEKTAASAQQGVQLATQALEAARQNAAALGAWSGIIDTFGNRITRSESRVDNIGEIQASGEERMTKYVTLWESTADDVRKQERDIDTLQEHYQTVAIASAQAAASVQSIQTTFSPRNVLSAMIVFASLIGLDSGAIQQSLENFSKLFGG